MGMVHRMVVESCTDYFVQMRRRVYQTPRSFLSFLGSYKDLYLTKKEEVDVKSKRVVVGLDKLKKGASDVEAMKVQLKEEEIKLKEADLATTKMLSKLEVCVTIVLVDTHRHLDQNTRILWYSTTAEGVVQRELTLTYSGR